MGGVAGEIRREGQVPICGAEKASVRELTSTHMLGDKCTGLQKALPRQEQSGTHTEETVVALVVKGLREQLCSSGCQDSVRHQAPRTLCDTSLTSRATVSSVGYMMRECDDYLFKSTK